MFGNVQHHPSTKSYTRNIDSGNLDHLKAPAFWKFGRVGTLGWVGLAPSAVPHLGLFLVVGTK